VDDDGNLQDEIRLPNDRLGELAEEYAGGKAAIEASGHYRPLPANLRDAPSISTLRSLTHQKPGYRRCDSQDRPN
jgi:hypothetical protein